MKQAFIVIFFTFFSLNTFAQNVLERKISGGLIFSGILFNGELSTKDISNNIGEGNYETEKIPCFGIGFFLEYHHNKHNFGLRQQTVLHTWEYGGAYKDSMDENYFFYYSIGFTDYTEYKFNNFFAYYGYSFAVANFQPTLKMSVGYHNVQLSGYSSYYHHEHNGVDIYEDYEDQVSMNYWSIKPEFEGEFRFSKHMSAFAIMGYDLALGGEKEYQYDYDDELIGKDYINEISRTFTPANYFELSLGVAFSF